MKWSLWFIYWGSADRCVCSAADRGSEMALWPQAGPQQSDLCLGHICRPQPPLHNGHTQVNKTPPCLYLVVPLRFGLWCLVWAAAPLQHLEVFRTFQWGLVVLDSNWDGHRSPEGSVMDGVHLSSHIKGCLLSMFWYICRIYGGKGIPFHALLSDQETNSRKTRVDKENVKKRVAPEVWHGGEQGEGHVWP